MKPNSFPRPGHCFGAALALAAWLGSGCALLGGGGGGPLPELSRYEGRPVSSVEFSGELDLPADSLQDAIVTRPTRCRILFIPVCVPGTKIGLDEYRLDLDELSRDVARLQLYYRDQGYYGTRVTPAVDPLDDGSVEVRFLVRPGDLVYVTELAIDGTEGIVTPDELKRRIPLRAGEPFGRADFLDSADTIRAALLREGYAYGEVLRNYSIDTIADISQARYVAVPGPLVRVDTIVVLGAERLGEETVRRQITFDEGDVLRTSELNESQRNLYQLGFVGFSSVEIAPDTLQRSADRARATVLVRVVERPRFAVDSFVGYGTIDCLRTGASWTDLNFMGGSRRLEVSGRFSKIGVGSPLDLGLENSLCPALAEDRFSEELNYRLAVDFQQPRLLATGIRGSLRLHAERLSEIQLFQRESLGGQAALTRNLGLNTVLAAALSLENGQTSADPIIFCLGFEVCTPEAREPLERHRWSNSLTVSATRNRTRGDAFARAGNLLAASSDWASPVFGSDDQYLRMVGEGAAYREVREGWVLAGFLRAGTFLDGAVADGERYIPPERRFYAGGPNSVRGFERNALGPRAYVARVDFLPEADTTGVVVVNPATLNIEGSAVGGTRTVLGSIELRMPSPVLGSILRTAVFVDAGQVWARSDAPGEGDRPIVVTPGAGFRFTTPIGPIRLDVGYNGYGRTRGPLYLADESTKELVLVDPDFQPPDERGFWDRLQFHFAVGQPF